MKSIVIRGVKLSLGAISAFGLFWLTSHPKSKMRKRLPEVSLKNFTLLPNVQLRCKDRIYHLHHWVMFTMLYLLLFLVKRRLLKFGVVHGAILGAIIQGLSFPDRFKFSARG